MRTVTTLATLLAAALAASTATAGTVWMTGWDYDTGTTRLLGFDEDSGEQRHSLEGEYITAADVCDRDGTVYYLDGTSLKALNANGQAGVIADNIGAGFTGLPQVKVGENACTVWVYAIGNQEMHIIRNPGKSSQEHRVTEAFDFIETADVDDSNDDLWIGQYNGRIYRVSKKTGLRSYRMQPEGAFSLVDIEVSGGIVHVLRWSGLAGYANTHRWDTNPQLLYTDTSYQQLFDANADLATARILANSLHDPVVHAVNMYWSSGYQVASTVQRMTMDFANDALNLTNDRFVPFEDRAGSFHNHNEPVAAKGSDTWLYSSDSLRLVDATGSVLREINPKQVHAGFEPYMVAY